MPEPGGPNGWGRRQWGPAGGQRPPWWPEGEAWPPADGAPWRRMRRRFLLRFTIALIGFVVVVTAVSTLVGWLLSRALDGPAHVLTGLLPLLVIVIGVLVVVRLVRRTGTPVADLVEAAGRIERGELSTRLPERGPRELRSVVRAFNAMTERLEATDAARRRLLADVSHELRTPLTVMQGTLEGILDGVYPADAAHLAPVLDETRILARLIDDLRTLSLSEAGALRLHREPTDLARLVREVAASHRAAADEAGVQLVVDHAEVVPLLDVDPERIRQVLANLIGNSLRATPAGGHIRLAIGADAGGVRVTVSDTGSGIARELLPHVFDRFHRSADSRGSGLGLAIARNLVEAHGGRIEIESEPGRGTTVRFSLPESGAAAHATAAG